MGFKAFQSSRNWFQYSEKQIGCSRGNSCNLHLLSTYVVFCTKQEIASIRFLGIEAKAVIYIHTYIRISEIKLVLTQGTQAGTYSTDVSHLHLEANIC